MTERRFVRWDAELQEAFERLVRREGMSAAARALHMPESNLSDFRRGLSRAGYRSGAKRPRKFLSLELLERLGRVLDDLDVEEREALTQREWSDRGEWAYLRAS